MASGGRRRNEMAARQGQPAVTGDTGPTFAYHRIFTTTTSSVHLPNSSTSKAESMAAKSTVVACLRRIRPSRVTLSSHAHRVFSTSAQARTDGVFRALTTQRNEKPWVEAFREQQVKGNNGAVASNDKSTPKDRDLVPKKMSDSYHSVVCALAALSPQLTD